MDTPSDEDSVGRAVYVGLVQLTFLCNRGIPIAELMERFLRTMRPMVPAVGLWLYDKGRLIASDADPGQEPEPPPDAALPPVAPLIDPERLSCNAFVTEGVTLAVRLGAGRIERASDVVMLMCRVLGLVWQTENAERPMPHIDDYRKAKAAFKKRWLKKLFERHKGGVTAAARAAGLSRVMVYDLVRQTGLGPALGVATAAKRETPSNSEESSSTGISIPAPETGSEESSTSNPAVNGPDASPVPLV